MVRAPFARTARAPDRGRARRSTLRSGRSGRPKDREAPISRGSSVGTRFGVRGLARTVGLALPPSGLLRCGRLAPHCKGALGVGRRRRREGYIVLLGLVGVNGVTGNGPRVVPVLLQRQRVVVVRRKGEYRKVTVRIGRHLHEVRRRRDFQVDARDRRARLCIGNGAGDAAHISRACPAGLSSEHKEQRKRHNMLQHLLYNAALWLMVPAWRFSQRFVCYVVSVTNLLSLRTR